VSTFARPLPMAVFGMFMGLEQHQIEPLEALIRQADDVQNAQATGGEAIMAMAAALGAIVEERVATCDEGDDLPRRLARTEVNGRKLTSAEILNSCHTMFVAGFDTTAGMLSMAARFFATHDEARRQLAADPSRFPDAIEEIVRLHAFVQSSRRVQQDVEIAGVQMRAGDQVLLPTSLASRDPAAVECPVDFDLDRSPNRHYGFGAGPHRCVGAHLARMELRVGLEEWFRLIPEFELAPDFVVPFAPGHVIGISELRLAWPTSGGAR
jgi:cytochrome P450